jgi:hypothetical protein
MLRENVNDLLAFLVVARERSFGPQPSSVCRSPGSAMQSKDWRRDWASVS